MPGRLISAIHIWIDLIEHKTCQHPQQSEGSDSVLSYFWIVHTSHGLVATNISNVLLA